MSPGLVAFDTTLIRPALPTTADVETAAVPLQIDLVIGVRRYLPSRSPNPGANTAILVNAFE